MANENEGINSNTDNNNSIELWIKAMQHMESHKHIHTNTLKCGSRQKNVNTPCTCMHTWPTYRLNKFSICWLLNFVQIVFVYLGYLPTQLFTHWPKRAKTLKRIHHHLSISTFIAHPCSDHYGLVQLAYSPFKYYILFKGKLSICLILFNNNPWYIHRNGDGR